MDFYVTTFGQPQEGDLEIDALMPGSSAERCGKLRCVARRGQSDCSPRSHVQNRAQLLLAAAINGAFDRPGDQLVRVDGKFVRGKPAR